MSKVVINPYTKMFTSSFLEQNFQMIANNTNGVQLTKVCEKVLARKTSLAMAQNVNSASCTDEPSYDRI